MTISYQYPRAALTVDCVVMTARHRPAQLFRFNSGKYEKLKQRGLHFEF